MDGDDQAFPRLEETYKNRDDNYSHSSIGGLTKRELFAAMAMQGILSGYNIASLIGGSKPSLRLPEPSVVRRAAVDYADVLIAELSKEAP